MLELAGRLRRVAARAIVGTGLVSLWPTATGHRHLILTFHRIREPGRPLDPFDSCPSLNCHQFQAILEYVGKRFEIVPLGELVERRSQSGPLAAITFDDGWRDNYDLALPILRAMRIPATVFVTTGKIGACEPFWQQILGERFREARGHGDSAAMDAKGYRATVEAWKRLPRDERDDRLLRLGGEPSPGMAAPRCFLSGDEIREMSRYGITFGSHSVSHAILTREQPEAVAIELSESKSRLESILGIEIDMLAFPNGDFSPQVVEASRQAGYRIACTTQGRRVGSGDDPLRLPRVEPPWEAMANGGLDLSLLRWAMR